ncbi:MAG TPA: phosphoribulokinase, partial [Burkholderiales bacterium]|nr:phosphoribulokinase [Burkholderiales bacterium]
MSTKHPIIAVTGSSGAGTTSVTRSFQHIFRREKLNAAIIEGDSFHRYDRKDMKARMAEAATTGNPNFSHFGPEANLLEELQTLFLTYGETGRGKLRHYVHDDAESARYGSPPGTFTAWEDVPAGTDLMFYEGLHGAAQYDGVDVAKYADLRIGVVPIINL